MLLGKCTDFLLKCYRPCLPSNLVDNTMPPSSKKSILRDRNFQKYEEEIVLTHILLLKQVNDNELVWLLFLINLNKYE